MDGCAGGDVLGMMQSCWNHGVCDAKGLVHVLRSPFSVQVFLALQGLRQFAPFVY